MSNKPDNPNKPDKLKTRQACPDSKTDKTHQACQDSKYEKAEKADKARQARRRKIILPKKTHQVDNVTVVPTLNSLMSDALSIIGAELTHYRSKTSRGINLDLKEARVIANYMDTLTRASKEAREQARAEDLADLTNEELLQLASQIASSKADKNSDPDTGSS